MDTRTPLIVVSGRRGPTERTARALLRPGTVVVHHDLDHVGEGVVRRSLTTVHDHRLDVLELAHGCVSCTLREDLLPLLRRLHARSNVDRIVLLLDPRLEPEALCWAVEHVVVSGVVGQIDGPAAHDVRIEATVTCIDAATWLTDATGDEELDDDRTVAQVVVGQVEFADALVVRPGADGWQQAKLHAVLSRLAPDAPVAWGEDVDVEHLLRQIPPGARRGTVSDAHSPLLRGQPPLGEDCGVRLLEFGARRPFHPQRLHEAIDVLLDGVVRARGRAWVATQPDNALLIESAGEGLRVAHAGPWLAAMTPEQQQRVSGERRAMAALRWDDTHGDRDTSMVILTHDADPDEIHRALEWALLTDEEFADPAAWPTWDDPFGEYHEDPCDDLSAPTAGTAPTEGEGRA
ncbi:MULTISPECIES: GTP-binding protein [Rhodococcus]|uniref:ribosome hibernation factor-recruiting GTPase MRF n=1 Tax=Rhodococcus TaxID=1827 RepID=UPI00193AFF4A|nr:MULTISPECIES: GTP-binding protein [Rhodococcus]QRI75526.1 GTP-binding protein [Rhodococcus aetherivorans]QSE58935.1 GTP-binding protein [Rhodococcus sp. PSBB066]QSE69743.1 GTP-binding protein [Rhodococcus sp. PSBB049]